MSTGLPIEVTSARRGAAQRSYYKLDLDIQRWVGCRLDVLSCYHLLEAQLDLDIQRRVPYSTAAASSRCVWGGRWCRALPPQARPGLPAVGGLCGHPACTRAGRCCCCCCCCCCFCCQSALPACPCRSNQPNVHEGKLLDNKEGWHGAELSVVIAGASRTARHAQHARHAQRPASRPRGRGRGPGLSGGPQHQAPTLHPHPRSARARRPAPLSRRRRQLAVLPRQGAQVPAADRGHHAVRAGAAAVLGWTGLGAGLDGAGAAASRPRRGAALQGQRRCDSASPPPPSLAPPHTPQPPSAPAVQLLLQGRGREGQPGGLLQAPHRDDAAAAQGTLRCALLLLLLQAPRGGRCGCSVEGFAVQGMFRL